MSRFRQIRTCRFRTSSVFFSQKWYALSSAKWSLRLSATSSNLRAMAIFRSSGEGGVMNGSSRAKHEAIVTTGSRHRSTVATSTILASRGSTGRARSCRPTSVTYTNLSNWYSKTFYHTKKNCEMHTFICESSASMAWRISTALWIVEVGGLSGKVQKN